MVLECRRILWNATVSLQGTCWAIMFDGRPLPLRRNRSNVGGTQNSLLAKAKQIQREVVRMDDQTVLALQLEGYQSESVYLARGFDSISPCYYYISVGHVWQRTDNWMTQQDIYIL